MKIHIFSNELEVLELSESEAQKSDEIVRFVQENLIIMGMEPWPSVELEVFTYKSGSLVFASPVKVFVPSFLAAYSEER